jgi:hypothetical protein
VKEFLWKHRYVIGYAVIALSIRLMYATIDLTTTVDWYLFRLPIAEQISQGEMLYRDIPYNHMPIYPYYTGLAYYIFGDSYVALMFPAILGDALIAPLLYVLTKNHWIASLYVVSAVSIQECGNAHWDGLTTLFLLLAISYDDDVRFSVFAAVGICLKQFPAVALVRVFLGWKEARKLVYTTLFSLAIVGVFLICCPREFIGGITGHPVYTGEGSKGTLVGSMAWFVPYWLWAIIFISMLAITLYTFRASNYRNTVGILVFLLTFMMFVTHKHTEIAFIPFALLLIQRSRYWVLAYLFCQYFIMLRMVHNELVNYLFPLTFVIWAALVWENVMIAREAREAKEGPGDIIRPLDGPSEASTPSDTPTPS